MALIPGIKPLQRLFRRGSSVSRLCLEVRPDGIAWAVSPGTPEQAAGFAECLPAKRQQTLDELVASHGWASAPTTLILPIEQYQVFQVERPEGVEDSELADALKWKLKDFLDFSPTEAVSDVFAFPEDATRGRGPLVNLVAARKSLVQELVALVNNADLKLQQIDIAELALRNFAAGLDAGNVGVAVVHLRDRYGQMVVCRGETLYLSRRLELSYDDLLDASKQEEAVQALALEMQRSMDYFESQLGQAPPAIIRLVARDSMLPLTSMLGSYMAAGIDAPDWSAFALNEELDSRCLLAWSAGLNLSPGRRNA
ncbi:biogenesis protein MshI [Marinobacter persicus]|jgi:MSHA biogenesis protein MshI|uniref:MSHA biogenesis protein MshI n=1 Tax=Marinobacter persicus TaxID=930118 RepID=A0A2S6G4C1_9GAMM|nr:biogenesis protein MshI [Marinobacter persicus]PPK51824.1 MSHA biogenesis protein MshI [Marinobacter persicus]PPK53922.1 MSHA biogenesis protein MshI [Marinobacter persicus]PPK58755.1 MSHA biogenesis protein MshI [Marinobacter persicus]